MDNELNVLKNKINEQQIKIDNLQDELTSLKKRVNYNPNLISTSLGVGTYGGQIVYRNWWLDNPEDMWFTRFLNHRFPDADYKFNFFSVFGDHYNIKKKMDGKKIFYTAESINKRFLYFNKNFGRYALKYVDFAMGNDLIEHNKYLRVPFWIMWNFSPTSSEEDIENIINTWNNASYEKTKNVAVIASHDDWGTRSKIVNDVNKFTHIDFAGNWNNNTSELYDNFNNNKFEYLKQFKFNICSENVVDDGYISEKIFDSIKSDCVPLYVGGNYLEPNVLNQNAIITWDLNSDNSDSVELFKMLISDEKSFQEFKDQDSLLPTSAKFIINKFNNLEKCFEKLIYD